MIQSDNNTSRRHINLGNIWSFSGKFLPNNVESFAMLLCVLFIIISGKSPGADSGDRPNSLDSAKILEETVMKDVHFKNKTAGVAVGEEWPDWGKSGWNSGGIAFTSAGLKHPQLDQPGLVVLKFLSEKEKSRKVTVEADRISMKKLLEQICRQADIKLQFKEGIVIIGTPPRKISLPDSPFLSPIPDDLVTSLQSKVFAQLSFSQASLLQISMYLNKRMEKNGEFGLRLAVDEAVSERDIIMNCRNITIYDLLRCVGAATNTKVHFLPEAEKLVFAPKGKMKSKISIAHWTSKIEKNPPLSGLSIEERHPTGRAKQFGIELPDITWSDADRTTDKLVVFNDRPPWLRVELRFSEGLFEGPDGNKIYIPPREKKEIEKKGIKVLKDLKVITFDDGSRMQIQIKPKKQKRRSKIRDLAINNEENWVAFSATSPTRSRDNGEPAFHPFYKKEGKAIHSLYKAKKFGQTFIPEGKYSLLIAVRLQLLFYGNSPPLNIVVKIKRRNLLLKASDPRNKHYYKSWIDYSEYIEERVPMEYREKLPGTEWCRKVALTALSEGEKHTEFNSKFPAIVYERYKQYEKAYSALKKNLPTTQELHTWGPRARDSLLMYMKKLSQKTGNPNPLKDYEFDPDAVPDSEREKE